MPFGRFPGFFTPRLAYERNRICAQVRAGEHVLVPFCGVGPFLIPAAVLGAQVVGIDMNPEACHWCAENALLNKVEENVTIIRGNAAHMPLSSDYRCDRIIIPAIAWTLSSNGLQRMHDRRE